MFFKTISLICLSLMWRNKIWKSRCKKNYVDLGRMVNLNLYRPRPHLNPPTSIFSLTHSHVQVPGTVLISLSPPHSKWYFLRACVGRMFCTHLKSCLLHLDQLSERLLPSIQMFPIENCRSKQMRLNVSDRRKVVKLGKGEVHFF
jgi:hypothetical protein